MMDEYHKFKVGDVVRFGDPHQIYVVTELRAGGAYGLKLILSRREAAEHIGAAYCAFGYATANMCLAPEDSYCWIHKELA